MEEEILVIQIRDTVVTARPVGNLTFYSQSGVVQWPNGDRITCEIPLPRSKQSGYAAGSYVVGGGSFTTDKYKRLALTNTGLFLKPVKAA